MDYKKLILALGLCLNINLFAQTTIIPGMTGTQFLNAINGNFTDIPSMIGSSISLVNNTIDSLNNLSALQNADVINLASYAVGDGVTDDKTALANALNAAKGKTLIIPSDTFYISNFINITLSNNSINIVGMPGSLIKSDAESYISFTCVEGAVDTFTIDPVKGTEKLIVKHASNNHMGDIMQIKSTDIKVNYEGYFKGEMIKVKKIVGDTIFLTAPLYDSYDKTTTHIYNKNAGTVNISGVEFYSVKIVGTGVKNSNVYNCKWQRTDYEAVNFTNYYKCGVFNCVFNKDTTAYSRGGGIYCIDFNSGQDATAAFNEISGYSQAIVYCGAYSTRQAYCLYNKITNHRFGFAQIDTHGGSEDVLIFGNWLFNAGIYSKGINKTISYNHIRMWEPNGRAIIAEEENRSADYVPPKNNFTIISYNDIVDYSTTGNSVGITLNHATYYDTIDYYNVSNNYCYTSAEALDFIGNTAYSRIKSVKIYNNWFQSYADGKSTISIYGSSRDINNLKISDNDLFANNAACIQIPSDSIGLITVEKNRFSSTGTICFSSTSNPRVNLIDNVFDGGSVLILNSDKAIIKGNTFKDRIGTNDIDINCDTLVYKDNYYIGKQRKLNIQNANYYLDETQEVTGSVTDGAPTITQINSISGLTPATAYKGYKLILRDSDGSGLTYDILSTGTYWDYLTRTRAQ